MRRTGENAKRMKKGLEQEVAQAESFLTGFVREFPIVGIGMYIYLPEKPNSEPLSQTVVLRKTSAVVKVELVRETLNIYRVETRSGTTYYVGVI